ncbi:aminotransferase class I/II-fold pyridoxal phosphate-dependent enzyme [Bartonella vinsonii]|uniref:8-amino-7-oxononanoate synthase n=1 Tax=Bartonella vinsonii TaxID=33047 RepID=A0A448V812_BARVI|nr:aminotransferase class I/II-fold pyridoxal phosphate-dependent enzyme [Bartonella vinsonii]VEJ45918.1 8-amino-7-oxononanoate synthase [Bartonella vinsonii]
MRRENWLSNRIKNSCSHQDKIWKQGLNDLTIVARTQGQGVVAKSGEIYVDFMSCSYLGLECHPALGNAVKASVDKFGVQYAAARTRAKCALFDELELKLNKIFLDSHSVIFNSVGAAHLAVMPILSSRELPGYPITSNGILWIIDKETHASVQILRGILEQFGNYIRIQFKDTAALEKSLQESKLQNKTPVLVSDSLGSMGGANDVKKLTKLAKLYGGYYYADDAHGTSIIGKNGCGYTLHLLKEYKENLILLSSLSKAFGSHGGSVSFSNPDAASFIKKYALNYIFSGPPSLPGIAACLASADIHLSEEINQLQLKLHEHIAYFDERVLNVQTQEKLSPIRSILMGIEDKAINASYNLRKRGFLVTAAMYPTVAKKRSIIRVAISAAHTKHDLETFAANINELTELSYAQ